MHLEAPPPSQRSGPYCSAPSTPDGNGGGGSGGRVPCREPPHVLLILITGMSIILLVLAFLLILLVFSHLHFRHSRRRRRLDDESFAADGSSPLPRLPPPIRQPLPLETHTESLVLVVFPGEDEPTTFAKPAPRFVVIKGDDDLAICPTSGDGQMPRITIDHDHRRAVNRAADHAVNYDSQEQDKTDHHVIVVPVVTTGLNSSPIRSPRLTLDATPSSSRLSEPR